MRDKSSDLVATIKEIKKTVSKIQAEEELKTAIYQYFQSLLSASSSFYYLPNELVKVVEESKKARSLIEEAINQDQFPQDVFQQFNLIAENILSREAKFQPIPVEKGAQQGPTNILTTMPSQPSEEQQTFNTKENTLLFWKTKHNFTLGNGNELISKVTAILRCKYYNSTDIYCTWKAVTLSDQQLQLITDEQTNKIKENLSLNHLNPFSPDILKDMNQHQQSHPEPSISPLTGSGSSATFAVTHNGRDNSTTSSKNEQTPTSSLG